MNPALVNLAKISIGKRRWVKRMLPRQLRLGTAFMTLGNGIKIFLDPHDMRGPSFHLMYGGEKAYFLYEKVDKDEVLVACDKKDGAFLDIGSNIGLFWLYLIQQRKQRKVFAFEPHPKLYECQRQTCLINHFENVLLFPLALSESSEKSWFYLDGENDGGHSLIAQKIHAVNGKIPVQSVSLDGWVSQLNPGVISVLKIDVQGAEMRVLKGGLKTIEEHRPVLVIECDTEELLAKENLFSLLREIDPPRFQCRIPGKDDLLDLSAVRKAAKNDLLLGQKESNFVFSWG